MCNMTRQTDSANELIKAIEKLKSAEIKKTVDARIKQFKKMGNKPSEEVFKELCFCILCANYTAEGAIKIQKAVEDGFLTLQEKELAEKLRSLGHRFPAARANYITQARQYAFSLKNILASMRSAAEKRDWLIRNIKGIGPKEASHFLRNIGYTNLAILDFHIIDVLVRYGLIKKPRTLTKKRYLEIENLLREVAEKTKLTLAELDLYLWYMETGKVLK